MRVYGGGSGEVGVVTVGQGVVRGGGRRQRRLAVVDGGVTASYLKPRLRSASIILFTLTFGSSNWSTVNVSGSPVAWQRRGTEVEWVVWCVEVRWPIGRDTMAKILRRPWRRRAWQPFLPPSLPSLPFPCPSRSPSHLAAKPRYEIKEILKLNTRILGEVDGR